MTDDSIYARLLLQKDAVNKWMERCGVRFGIYKNGTFKEQIFPFDAIPRVITAADWQHLSRGLAQRVMALNAFLKDVYTTRSIVRDGVIPADFIFSSKGYLPQCEGIIPSADVFSHISGIDLVQADDGTWYVLEDNLRVPSGASYPLIARDLTRKVSPETFSDTQVLDNRDYPNILRRVLDDVNVSAGLEVVLTPGRYNSAFFEHSYLAEKAGVVLAFPDDLFVEDDIVYYKGLLNKKERVGVIYRRISDEYMDPMTFEKSSLLGIPNVFSAYRKGNVAIVNAFGNGVADDKGIYYFFPKMVKYYLGEEPILRNAPTYLPIFPDDYKYVIENLPKLVIKDVAEAGGYGVMFGRDMSSERLAEVRAMIKADPRRWIAQDVINFIDLDIMDGDTTVKRKSDFRAFVLSGKQTEVWPSGLTRFTRDPKSFVVNSSQGGGFKDTWVLAK
ncbi:MAG: circularly permuted type 2 ATP-grasp protein [Bacteroidales bacterium]|nr:circularly permuted type 2 ATP-grasp protein [Bacteroidales bacterium]MDD7724624.1 circularly permuted type 2 ATP-grasp protein [Bacteroidales bacterium]